MEKLIYLDNAATTKTSPEVVSAMLPYFTEHFGNPSSVYGFASANKEVITKQREIIAGVLGAKANEIYFTAGGTESDNISVIGAYEAAQAKDPARDRIIISGVEHHAVLDPTMHLAKSRGARVSFVEPGECGDAWQEEGEAARRPALAGLRHRQGGPQPVGALGIARQRTRARAAA